MVKVLNTALACLQYGLSVIAIRPGTKVPVGLWKRYQTNRMTENEARSQFIEGMNIALLGGAVSGHLECYDFDKSDLYKPFMDTLESVNPELHKKLVVTQETPSGGYHILVRCTDPIDGSKKLAMGPKYQGEDGKLKQDTLIESKGEGG